MTEFLIIISTEDQASMNIRENFLSDNLMKFKELDTLWHGHPVLELEMVVAKRDWGPFFVKNKIYLGLTECPLIFLDDIKLNKTDINPDLLIFASRHRSETARPAFLTHTTGNWNDKAALGGNPNEICEASAFLLKSAFLSLQEQTHTKKMTDFMVDLEVTHHGPTNLERPLVFVELGSSEKEWGIKKAGLLVAHAILGTCLKYSEYMEKKAPQIGIGFGGTHYAPQFRKLIAFNDVSVSYICPKYYIQNLDKSFIDQMINNTMEKVEFFVIDWKGTNSADKQHLMPILEDYDIPIKKTKDF